MNDYPLHHIGYLTDDIRQTAEQFLWLGYEQGEIIDDDTQRTHICFLTKPGDTAIELVQPYDDNATMLRMLKKRGASAYHVCYECDDVDWLYATLPERNWTPLFRPVEAPALGNHKIGYFFNAAIGLVEFVNR